MILCLDVGNTQIFGGVFEGGELKLKFRHGTRAGTASDEFGVFLKNVLRENGLAVHSVRDIAIGSVVPSLDYSLISACKKYFNLDPFILKAGVKTGLQIKTRHPLELGADLIAGGIAAAHQFPEKNIIVVDFGTATTFAVISAKKEYLGTVILPGIRLSMLALGENAAKLHPVEIITPKNTVGRNTAESIQSGLYYGQIGMVKEITQRIISEAFNNVAPVIVGTGGFVSLFNELELFTAVDSHLVLDGLRLALQMNQ